MLEKTSLILKKAINMKTYRRLPLLIAAFHGLLALGTLSADTSASQNLADLQNSFDRLRDGFLAELSSVPDQPDKLENGTLLSDAETLSGKDLKDLLDQLDHRREILKKQESALASKGLSESDKEELRQALRSQKQPLDSLQKKITDFRSAVDDLKSSGIQNLKSSYDEFLSIKGQQAASDKIRVKISAIEEPFLPPKPKATPTPLRTPRAESRGTFVKSDANGLRIEFAVPLNQVTNALPSAPSPTPEDSHGGGGSIWSRCPEAAAFLQGRPVGATQRGAGILGFEEARSRADNGDAYAQAVISIYYATGYMTPKNLELAAKYAVLSAQQKNPLGIYRLGVMREAGEGGIAPNPQEGIALKAAAFPGLNNEMVGDPYAITALGVMCFRGEAGVNKNPAQAASLYKKAADKGYAPAQYCYSACLYNGQGVQRNPQLAEQYWRLACQQQYPPALRGRPVE
jgi:hypothetical protein